MSPAGIEKTVESSNSLTTDDNSGGLEVFRTGLVGLIFVSILGYLILLVGYVAGRITGWPPLNGLVTMFLEPGPIFAFGLPFSAAAAFGIVAVFDRWAPSHDDKGQISFKAFGAEFSGPAAPATLWIACFLTFVLALKVGSDIEPRQPAMRPVVTQHADTKAARLTDQPAH